MQTIYVVAACQGVEISRELLQRGLKIELRGEPPKKELGTNFSLSLISVFVKPSIMVDYFSRDVPFLRHI